RCADEDHGRLQNDRVAARFNRKSQIANRKSMKILDRYVLFTFIKNYLISLLALLGLYIVLDMVFSFDELAEVQQRSQLVATVKDVQQQGENIRATLSLRRDDTAAPKTE